MKTYVLVLHLQRPSEQLIMSVDSVVDETFFAKLTCGPVIYLSRHSCYLLAGILCIDTKQQQADHDHRTVMKFNFRVSEPFMS